MATLPARLAACLTIIQETYKFGVRIILLTTAMRLNYECPLSPMTPGEVFPHSDLEDLPEPLKKELLALAEVVDLPKGTEVWKRGQPLDGKLHLVLSGTLRVIYRGKNQRDEHKDRSVGKVCGEYALFNPKEKRSAHVSALTDVRLLCWENAKELIEDPHFEPFRKRLSVLSNATGVETDNL